MTAISEKEKVGMKKVLMVGLLAAVTVAAVGCSTEIRDQPGVARQACHDFVSQRITVSDFESKADAQISSSTGGEWTVKGRAATAVGPILYTCRIRMEAADDQIRLLELTGV